MCGFSQAHIPWQMGISGMVAEVGAIEPLFSSKANPVNLHIHSSWAIMYCGCILEGSIPTAFCAGPGVCKSLAGRPACAFTVEPTEIAQPQRPLGPGW